MTAWPTRSAQLMGTESESPHQRFFAQTNEGDPRQVYALDTRREDPTIFFLARGGATEIVRQDTRAGAYSCPVPDCPCPTFKMVRSGVKRDHFVHEFDPGRDHLEVSPSFYVSRLLAERALRDGFDVLLAATLATDVVTDLLMWDEHLALVAVFVASHRLTAEIIKAQAEAARRFDATPRWVFSVPGPLAQVQDVERKECSWLVARQDRAVWVNPVEGRVLTQPTGRAHPDLSDMTVASIDEWDMDELGVGRLTPLADRSELPHPGSVWTASDQDAVPTEHEREAAIRALADGGFSGVLLVTDQADLQASLANALAPAATVERVAIDGVTRESLRDRLVLVYGCGDFVESIRERVPSFAEDQTVLFMATRPSDVSRALWVVAERYWA